MGWVDSLSQFWFQFTGAVHIFSQTTSAQQPNASLKRRCQDKMMKLRNTDSKIREKTKNSKRFFIVKLIII